MGAAARAAGRVTLAPGDGRGREILFEFVTLGQQVRVAAVDALTGVEAIVIGPAGAARADLERLATNKLLYLLGGRARRGPSGEGGNDNADTSGEQSGGPPPSRGRIV